MKNNELYKIQDAVEVISEITDANYEEIIDALVPLCWDEETAGDIKFSMIDD